MLNRKRSVTVTINLLKNAVFSLINIAGNIRGMDIDKREQAAILLEKLSQGKAFNRRPLVILKILKEIKEGHNNSYIQHKLGLDNPEAISVISHQALLELINDSGSLSSIKQIYLDLTGRADPAVKLFGRKKRRVYSKLYPVYLQFRKRLGDQPENNIFNHLSPHEKQILELIAQGLTGKKISQRLKISIEGFKINRGALLKPDFGNVRGREEMTKEFNEIFRILSSISLSENLWKNHYPSFEDLQGDLDLFSNWQNLVADQSSQEEYEKLKLRLYKIRAIVRNIKSNQAPSWRNTNIVSY